MRLKNIVKILNIIFFSALLILGTKEEVFADYDYKNSCNKETAMQLAKIVYKEVGPDLTYNNDDNFYARLLTASVATNIANTKNGSTLYEKLYNLTDNNYQGYSSYKDKEFTSVVDSNKQGEMLYIAELVLSGKFNLPKEMNLQANKEIVERYANGGKAWTIVKMKSGFDDLHIGNEKKLGNKDIFGNTISDTSPNYYKNLANSLKLSSYSKYTTNNVCSGNHIDSYCYFCGNSQGGKYIWTKSGDTTRNCVEHFEVPTKEACEAKNNTSGDKDNNKNKNEVVIIKPCENPEILKVFYFLNIIIDIVKIVIPIGLIVIGMIDFSKALTSNDEGSQKKSVNLFIKRVIMAILVFLVPWIVETLIIWLGNLADGVNFTDCLENANREKIDELEKEINNK